MIILPTHREAKDQAKRLRRALADRGVDLGHSQVLELIAAVHGVRDWNTLSGLAPTEPPGPSGQAATPVVPILRMFDWAPARAFYLDFLGWTLEGEPRFEDHVPRYVRLRGPEGARVDLSEHNGDGTPGTAILIMVPDAAALHATLVGRDYGYAEPGLEESPLGRTVTVHDPSATGSPSWKGKPGRPNGCRMSCRRSCTSCESILIRTRRSTASPRSPGGGTTASSRAGGR
jgi:hypothetical protein